MKVTISGTRDGQAWPERGGTLELPEDEAKQLLAGGLAEEDDGEAPGEENAVAPGEPEKAAGRAKPAAKPATQK
ncbi:hypothetical protein EAO71_20260 [Streptomyces sp. ms191]|nr:hypothetical protein EAO71_20260 [Streptomyces sp. ms191]